MPTPVEVSYVKLRTDVPGGLSRIEGLGGIFRDRPWYMSERNLIAEAQHPEDRRTWNFYVSIGGRSVPLAVAVHDGRKYLTTLGEDAFSATLLALPPMPLGWAEHCD